MSYNPNQHPHPSGGEVVAVNIDGKMYINPANKAYMDSLKKPKSLDRIKSDTVNSVGFSKSKKIEEGKSERDQKMDRLAILQNTEARLVKELEGIRQVIKIVEESI